MELPNTSPEPINEAAYANFMAEYTVICNGTFNSIPQYHEQIKNLSLNPLCFPYVAKALLTEKSEAIVFLSSSIIINHIKKFGSHFTPNILQDLGLNLLNTCCFDCGRQKLVKDSINKLIAVLLKYTWLETVNPLRESIELLLNNTLTEALLEFLIVLIDEMQSNETKVSTIYRRVYYSFESKWLCTIARFCIFLIASISEKKVDVSFVRILLITFQSCLKYNEEEENTSDFYVTLSTKE